LPTFLSLSNTIASLLQMNAREESHIGALRGGV